MWVLCAFFETAIITTKPAFCLLYIKPSENQPSNIISPIRPTPPIKPILCSVCCNIIAAPKMLSGARGIIPALRPVGGHLWPSKSYLSCTPAAFLPPPSLPTSPIKPIIPISSVCRDLIVTIPIPPIHPLLSMHLGGILPPPSTFTPSLCSVCCWCAPRA